MGNYLDKYVTVQLGVNDPPSDMTITFPVFKSGTAGSGEIFTVSTGAFIFAWSYNGQTGADSLFSDTELQWLHDNVDTGIPSSLASVIESINPNTTTSSWVSVWFITGSESHFYAMCPKKDFNGYWSPTFRFVDPLATAGQMQRWLETWGTPYDFGAYYALSGMYKHGFDSSDDFSWVKCAEALVNKQKINLGSLQINPDRENGFLYNLIAYDSVRSPLYIAGRGGSYPTIYYPPGTMNVWDITEKCSLIGETTPSDNPFEFLPTDAATDPKGGNGNYNNGTDDIDFSDPDTDITVTALSSGFLTAYKVNSGILSRLGDAMWADADIIRDIFGGDIMGSIVSLTILPIEPTAGASQNIKLANWDTTIPAPVITKQYVTVDMGTLVFNEYHSSYLDYAPNTKAEIYLPFIGERQLDIDDIMDASLHLKYQIDVLTGACVAQLKVTKKNTGGKHISELNSVMYSWDGNVANNMPLSGQSYANLYSAMVGGIGAALAVGISGGAAAPVVGAVSSAANILGSSKPTINRSGNLGGGTGLLSVQKPYITLSRPVQSIAPSALALTGFPSNVGGQLSNFSGFIKINKIDLDNIACTAEEAEEIRRLMAGGVYVD